MKVELLQVGDCLRNINNTPYWVKAVEQKEGNEIIVKTFNIGGERWFFWLKGRTVPFNVLRDGVELK